MAYTNNTSKVNFGLPSERQQKDLVPRPNYSAGTVAEVCNLSPATSQVCNLSKQNNFTLYLF